MLAQHLLTITLMGCYVFMFDVKIITLTYLVCNILWLGVAN